MKSFTYCVTDIYAYGMYIHADTFHVSFTFSQEAEKHPPPPPSYITDLFFY